MKKVIAIWLINLIILSFILVIPVDSLNINTNTCVSKSFSRVFNNYRKIDYDIRDILEGVTSNEDDYTIMEDLPEGFDWREAYVDDVYGNWVTPIKDQGTCGGCWAFATCASLESRILIVNKDPNYPVNDLSEQYLISCCPEPGCNGCLGGAAFWALSYLYTHGGAVPETCFYYECFNYIYDEYVPPCDNLSSSGEDSFIKTKAPIIVFDPSINFIKTKLIEFGPLVTPMTLYDDFINYSGGVYDNPNDNPNDPWDHEVVIIGYKDDPIVSAGGYWICKNSNGTDWGENGFFRIAYGNSNIGDYINYAEYVKSGINKINVRYTLELNLFSKLLFKNLINILLFKNSN